MNKEVATKQSPAIAPQTLASLILQGDLSGLKPEEKVVYYNKVCDVVGLNPLTKPFDYLKMKGKEVLYANKGCAEQLRQVHGISIKITQIQTVQDVYVVVAEASDAQGRHDSSSGAVPIKGLFGEDLANAFMKCETKAKRRVTLSICGLNVLDETEVAIINGAETSNAQSIPSSVPSPITNVVAPLKPAPEAHAQLSREELGKAIVEAKKILKLTTAQLSEWGKQKTGKDLKDFSDYEMSQLLDELQFEIGRNAK